MIFGVFGMMSSGKGVWSTKMLREMRKENPKRVIANCYLNLPSNEFTRLTTEELYLKSREPQFFERCYLYITELHSIIDARRSSSLLNTNFTQFLSQIGKVSCTVIYDSQLFESQIDVRMRDFTPIRFFCERYKLINNIPVPALFDDRIIKDPIVIALEVEHNDFRRKLGFYRPVQEDYDFYKTREVIYLNREKFKSSSTR